ncbi:MAG TPA: hypothetical protein VMC85_03180 [Desulfomonilaceae bacterium]|nr:hypothetical protein [Desulfomonilaceae bacterium]
MVRVVPILLLAVLLVTATCFGQAGKPQANVIPVRPAYDEPAQQSGNSSADPAGPELPKPSEQLYVFWFLGKIISYPVDTAEAYITSYIEKWRQPPQPVAVPASSRPNPFDSVKWRAIPPAPPIAVGDEKRH